MKYNKKQLKEMAVVISYAKNNGDFRYIQFLVTVMTMSGFNQVSVERKIQEYINY